MAVSIITLQELQGSIDDLRAAEADGMHPEDREKEIRLLQNRADAVRKQVAPKTPSTPSSGSLDDAQPSYLRRAWVGSGGVFSDEGAYFRWHFARDSDRRRGVRRAAHLDSHPSPCGYMHPPGCPCGRPTCPSQAAVARMADELERAGVDGLVI